MNRVILCEGKTDAILLSYYLKKIAGWEPAKHPSGLAIKKKNNNESVEWYKKENEMLMICAVGGKDNFSNFFSRDIEKAMRNASNSFSRIVIVTDKDDRDIYEIEKQFAEHFSSLIDTVENNVWKTNTYTDAFDMPARVDVLLLVIPTNQQGALETVMLSAISENPYDKIIVEKCNAFVKEIRLDADKYITTKRLELKAHLSTVWAIQSPDKAFDFINEQIESVDWKKYKTIHQCFGILKEL